MTLLYFSNGYTTHDRRFLESFIAAGYEVHFLRLTTKQLDGRSLPNGVREVSWRGAASPAGLLEIIEGIHPDAVLAGPVQTAAHLVTQIGFRHLITMSWGSDILVDAERDESSHAVTQFTLQNSSAAFGDCLAVRYKIRELGDVPDNRIVTFPWGIDHGQFHPRASASKLRQELGWDDAPVLISTRTWEPLYSIHTLVEAFAALRQDFPASRLLLLGDGSQDAGLRAQISTLGLSEYVHAPGRITYDALPDYFNLADVYVSTALSDGSSLSLLEAMACGLPAIVTAGYGNLEWVQPGRNGWLVPPSDAAALSNALREALSNAPLRHSMGRSNAALVREKADWTKNFPQLLALLEKVAECP